MGLTKREWLKVLAAAAALTPATAAAQGRGGRRGESAAQSADPLPMNELESRVFGVLDDIDRNQRHLNVSRDDGRLLRVLAQSIGARHVIEIGTSTGYSGLWLALALHATGGRLTTFEIDRSRAGVARENFKRSGLGDLVTVVVGDAHEEVKSLQGPIDLVFLDADKEGYPDYLDKLRPLLRVGGLIVADNMRRPTPDPRYIRAVTSDPKLETLFLNMQGSGTGVTLKKA